MLYALIALSMPVIYRATTVVNFGHGDMVAAGAYAAFVLTASFGVSFVPALLLSGSLVTKVPRPRCGETKPSQASSWIAWRDGDTRDPELLYQPLD